MPILVAVRTLALTPCEHRLLEYFLGNGHKRPPTALELQVGWGGTGARTYRFCCEVVWCVIDRDALNYVDPTFYTCLTTPTASPSSSTV